MVEIREREFLLRAVGEGNFDPGGRVELDGAFEELAVAGAEGTGVSGERGGAGEEEESCPRNTRMGADGASS